MIQRAASRNAARFAMLTGAVFAGMGLLFILDRIRRYAAGDVRNSRYRLCGGAL